MKIPRDLKPGDRLWYSKTEYATAQNRPGKESPYWWDYSITAMVGANYMFYDQDGNEEFGDTPPIIRIERIASAPAKVKRAKVDKDAAWLRRFTVNVWPYEAKRIRAIARRLEGGGK